jgi:hypothetical protein
MGPTMKAIYVLCVVLSLGGFGCSSRAITASAATNTSAAVIAELPANPLQWRVITSAINRPDSTMWTLYGNDLAVGYARTNSQHQYPAGAELSLVTWTQREDDRWFGARIPDHVKSVEFVLVNGEPNGKPTYSYVAYEGSSLTKVSAHDDVIATGRTAYLLSQRAAVMP